MSDSDVEQLVCDPQQSGQDFHIRDNKGKGNYNTLENLNVSDL